MREAIASESGTQQQGKTSPTAPLDPTWLGPRPASSADRLTGWVARHPRAPLLLASALALAARALLIVRTHAMIDGDEALVGIQAERILHGQFPTYFYLQPYMGSLEAYLAAALFRVFGPSSWALRAVPLLLSLPLVYLTWRLARALLPKAARTTPLLAGIAALFAAAPPLYDAVAELRTWGGQIEIYVVSLALLLCAVELAGRLRAGAGSFELARRWAILGLFAGLGIWINPLVTYALAACALWLLPPLIARVVPHLWARLLRRPAVSPSAISSPASTPRATLTPLLALIPGVALGGLPAWLYAIQHSGENLLIFVSQPSVSGDVSGAARHGRLFLGAAITARYATCVAPRALAGGLPAETLAWLPLRLALLLPPLLAIATALWLLRRGRSAGAGAVRSGLPLLYAAIITAVFCLGTSAWAATKPCERDWAGRYAVPLVLVEPFLLLALFAAPWAWTTLRRHAPNEHTIRRGWSVALLVLLLGGALQLGTYSFASPSATFQSPYYPRVPLDTQPLLDYLNAHHITAAWCNHWLGNIVTFQTNGATTCADYYDQVYLHGLQRPPGSLQTVTNATTPSFILVGQGAHPLLAQELDAQNIPYTAAYIPASNVTVITPARTVDPATVIVGLAVDYPY
ncbi:MAG: hypothetical protein OJF49_001191 [Ktedonobacterales bacterium]|nr:MAG: hypothetical protein OJF49_001191 [Ktedonobacterales bacterium]